MVVPTGVGAEIGGYAGDALPAARALGAVVDELVTHPNVLNGATLYWPTTSGGGGGRDGGRVRARRVARRGTAGVAGRLHDRLTAASRGEDRHPSTHYS